MEKFKKKISKEKAKLILQDNEIRSKPLTEKQKKYFRYVAYAEEGLNNPLNDVFERVEREQGIPKEILLSFAKRESNLNPNAVGPKIFSKNHKIYKRAYGLMQIHQDNFDTLGLADWRDPYQNITAAAKLLKKYHSDNKGDWEQTAIEYHGGEGFFRKYGKEPLKWKKYENYYMPLINDINIYLKGESDKYVQKIKQSVPDNTYTAPRNVFIEPKPDFQFLDEGSKPVTSSQRVIESVGQTISDLPYPTPTLNKVLSRMSKNVSNDISEKRNEGMYGYLPSMGRIKYAQDGINNEGMDDERGIVIKDEKGKERKVSLDEYTKLYNSGKLATTYDEKTYAMRDLPEVEIKGKKTPFNRWIDKYTEQINKETTGPLSMLMAPINAALSLPQMGAVSLFAGKPERPSEAMDIENPVGAIATDVVLDPLNLIGLGLWNKGKSLTKGMKLQNVGKPHPSSQTEWAFIRDNPTKANAPVRKITEEPWKLIEPTTNTLQIKSTMLGSPLEKQLSKTGEININSLKAYMNKPDVGQQDKFILDKVINEKFVGQTKIDYNELRKAVSDELVPLNRSFSRDYVNYGIDKLGYTGPKKESYDLAISNLDNAIKESEEIIKKHKNSSAYEHVVKAAKEDILRFKEKKTLLEKQLSNIPQKNESIIFGNKDRLGRGNTSHFSDEGTLGHSRILVSNDEPEVMHVLEVQSDFYQKGSSFGGGNRTKEQAKKSLEHMNSILERQKEILASGKEKSENIIELPDGTIAYKDVLEDGIKGQKEANDLLAAEIYNWEQKEFLGKTHQERLLQENVVYAAEQGKSKMRYPTSETAAKIEGYTPKLKYDESLLDEEAKLKLKEFQDKLSDIGTEDFHLDISELSQKRNRLGREIDIHYPSPKKDTYEETLAAIHEKYGEEAANKYKEFHELDERLLDEKSKISGKKTNIRVEIENYKRDLRNNPKYQKEGYEQAHETILKKYKDAPKMIKKTLGVETKIVTDPKGNTWYEFDIPKKFKEGKAEIKALSTIPLGIILNEKKIFKKKSNKEL